MFHEEFYPTPRKLLRKMLYWLNQADDGELLEPSAGKGDIIDAVLGMKNDSAYRRKAYNIDAVEIDPNLRHILKGQGIRVVHDDFLTFQTYKHYDVILMNPPFSQGAKHLRKALELLRGGGTCICILNAETLRNPCTNEREALLKTLEAWEAKIEYMAGEFIQAERKTDVEIAFIVVKKPAADASPGLILEHLRQSADMQDVVPEENDLVDTNPMHAAVARYNLEIRAGLKLLEEYRSLARLNKKSLTSEYANEIIEIKITPNEYVKAVREKYWEALFHSPELQKQLTQNLQSELHSRIGQFRHFEFNMQNIIGLRLELSEKLTAATESTILNLFDEMTIKHAWHDDCKQNRHYFDGWAANSAFKINKKVIIPISGYCHITGREDVWGRSFETPQKMADMVRVLYYLNGECFNPDLVKHILEQAKRERRTKNLEFPYFNITFYKKGTAHIVFTDEDVLKKLNIFGCQRKGWLPPCYGKKKYHDLTPEEKHVVDSYEGEASYRDVCARPEMIVNIAEMKLLEG